MKSKFLILNMIVCAMTSLCAQSYNTATGTGALNSITTGGANTATGHSAMYSSTTPWNCSAHGSAALYFNTTGNTNSAYGSNAISLNTGGNENSALGAFALYYNINGNRNCAAGYKALYSNFNGEYNTALGETALFKTGGHYNVGVGSSAGWINASGNYNTYIAYNTDNYPNTTYDYFSNVTVIGARTYVDASNKILVGNTSYTSYIEGQVSWSTISDKRIKRDIKLNVPGLDFITFLKPVTYHIDLDAYDSIVHAAKFNDTIGNSNSPSESDILAKKEKEKHIYTGFLAQDVEAAAKSIQYKFSGVEAAKNDNDLYSLQYEQFVVPLVKAVQELTTRNEVLLSKVNNLKDLRRSLVQQIEEVKKLQLICCPVLRGKPEVHQ